MRSRTIAAAGLVAIVIAVSVVAVAGQSSTSGASGATPRTAWGAPDLQGVWGFATVTPMERPTELAGKSVLTDAEAAEVERQATRSRPGNDLPPAEGNPGTYNDFWWDRGTKVVGDKRTSLVVDPPDGRIPAFTAEAQQRQAAAAAARRGAGPDEPSPGGFVEDLGPGGLRVRCILGFNSGPPMTPSAYNNNMQLFQTRDWIVILNEMNHNARVVAMDGRPHLGSNLRQWVGDSRGRWEGDTLVVETTNFLRETMFPNSSANLHLVERFTREDAGTLLYAVTVTDPTTWTRPWTFEVPMTLSDGRVYEYACHEGNYGLFNIFSGALAGAQGDEAKKGSK